MPVSVCDHTMAAMAAKNSSVMIPAMDVRIRFHFDENLQADVTSTYGSGTNKMQTMPVSLTCPPNALQAIACDNSYPAEERFEARLKLAMLSRKSAPGRLRSRCEITGRPRGYYRKFRISRIALRELASTGQIPGMVKSSW